MLKLEDSYLQKVISLYKWFTSVMKCSKSSYLTTVGAPETSQVAKISDNFHSFPAYSLG